MDQLDRQVLTPMVVGAAACSQPKKNTNNACYTSLLVFKALEFGHKQKRLEIFMGAPRTKLLGYVSEDPCMQVMIAQTNLSATNNSHPYIYIYIYNMIDIL